MANEVLTGSGGGTNILASEVASKMAMLKLADREALRSHPAILNIGEDLLGSTTEQFTIYGLDGSDLMSAATEIESIGNTALDTAKFTITTSRYALAYGYSDYMAAKDQTGVINPSRLALSITGSAMMTLTSNLAKLLDDFSNVVGSTGVPMTVSLFTSALTSLRNRGVPGPYLCVLHNEQYAQFLLDLQTQGGAIQFQPATMEHLALKGPGFQGTFLGVEIFTSSHVQPQNSGADWAGGIFGRGAIGIKEESNGPTPQSAHVLVDAGPVRIEEVREGRASKTDIIGNYRHGLVEVEDSRGTTILSAQS